MDKNMRRYGKDIIYLSVMILLTLFVTISSFSYAILTKDIIGEKHYAIQIGMFDFSMENEVNSIQLLNAYPMTDEEGKALAPYKFTITNTGDYEADYTVSLVEGEEEKASCTDCVFLNPNKLRYSLTVDGTVGSSKVVESTTLLDSNSLNAKQSRNYELRVWLNIDATIEEENKYYYGKIKVDAIQVDPNVQNTVSRKAFINGNLGENCKTYNDGIDTFLVGQCSKNYVWYSGKLWRVVLKNNETGAVKMITDDAITTIPYNEQNQTTFENSYVDQWLTQEFLPTLHDYNEYLVVDSIWDASLESSNTPSRPTGTTTVPRTVGLLNTYEFYTTYNNSDGLATIGTGYLNNGIYWWLINAYNESRVRHVYPEDVVLASAESIHADGVRPAVNLKANIQITSGTGTIEQPYRLEKDNGETTNGLTLLSTRYSGEYINFNGEMYRIIGTENNLIKIAAVNVPNTLTSVPFHNTEDIVNFGGSSVKENLENYYQNNIAEPYKSMVETGQVWYLGTISWGTNYKAGICEVVDNTVNTKDCVKTTLTATANVGLPRIGEMFSSQITRGTKTNIWTLTPRAAPNIRVILSEGYLTDRVLTDTNGARPSMYLKSNVVISSTNTGDGTYEHPYDVELGE